MPANPRPPSLLIDPTQVEPMDRGNGVVTIPYIGKWNCDCNVVTSGQSTFAVGTGLPFHSHNVDETVLILEGLATAEIEDESFDLVAGQATWVPSGVSHRFFNRGDGPMRIFWMYGGHYVTRTITATGVTVEHLSDDDRVGIVHTPQ